MSGATVLITCVQLQQTIDEHRERLESSGIRLVLPAVHGQQLSEADMLQLVPRVDGIVAGDDVITRAVLERADRLRIISKWGVGIDNVDLVAAAELGIRVTNTPGMFSDEVADVVIGYLILLARQLHGIDRAVRKGQWAKPMGISLAGRTLGIIGLGHIGRAVARRGLAMRMQVVGAEIRPDHAAAAGRDGVTIVETPPLLRQVDVVSLNCPLNAENHHMIDEGALAAMKPGAWVINTARGSLIDERALAAALESGHLGGAALDVFEEEPLPATSPLRSLENVILGTHNSSNTTEAVRRTSVHALENLLEGLAEVHR